MGSRDGTTPAPSAQARTLGLTGAVAIGAGSMLGAGVFAVWAPAARSAGGSLLLALGLAAVVAALNAASTAALASRHPVAGGAYSFGSRELPAPWGFVAGFGFVVGKTASVAAMGLTIGNYVWPHHAHWIATAAIAGAWLLNAGGVTRTAAATGVIAVAVSGVLIAAVIHTAGSAQSHEQAPSSGVWGVAQGAALLFFAFAGYARLATLGEEVERPRRTIPLAIAISFVVVLALYAAVALALVRSLGTSGLAASAAPIADAVGGGGWTVPLAVTAALASGGALVALLAGLGRTAMAMARQADLPPALARVNAKSVPTVAEALPALVAIVLVWFVPLINVLAASSTAVLLYYAVAHASAFASSRRPEGVRLPRIIPAVGLLLCVALVVTLPWRTVLITGAVLVLAVVIRLWLRRRAPLDHPRG